MTVQPIDVHFRNFGGATNGDKPWPLAGNETDFLAEGVRHHQNIAKEDSGIQGKPRQRL